MKRRVFLWETGSPLIWETYQQSAREANTRLHLYFANCISDLVDRCISSFRQSWNDTNQSAPDLSSTCAYQSTIEDDDDGNDINDHNDGNFDDDPGENYNNKKQANIMTFKSKYSTFWDCYCSPNSHS